MLCPNCNTQMVTTQSRKRNGGMIIAGIGIALVSLLGTGWVLALLMIAGILLLVFGLNGKKNLVSQCPACRNSLSESGISEKPKINWKTDWFKQWWIWAIAAALIIVAVNRVSIIVKEMSIPVVTFTMEESLGNRTENTQPLGIYDVQIIERSTVSYLTGKVKKNSTTPEQSYIVIDVELYDEKGRPVTSRSLDSGLFTTYSNDNPVLSFGDVYGFEIPIVKEAAQFRIFKLEEISVEERKADRLRRMLSDAEYNIKNENFDWARNNLDEALTIDPNNEDALALYVQLEEAEEAAKNRIDDHDTTTPPELTTETPPESANGLYYDETTGQWVTPSTSLAPDDLSETMKTFTENGYALVTDDNLYDGVKIYLAWDDPETIGVIDEIGHEYTVIGFGNDGIMSRYIYVSEIVLKNDTWIPINNIAYGVDEQSLAYLVKLDDPALSKAERTYISVEADNYRQVLMNDLIRGTNVYYMTTDGSMFLAYTVEKLGIGTVEVIRAGRLYSEKVDLTWAINNHYVRR